jgi:protein-S-isoprenylcysteine O-methyltransferase Ste14
MIVRALAAFLALPGVVAFLVPAAMVSATGFRFSFVGAVLSLAGVGVLLWCTVAFYINGKGTLAPWSPPRHLVTSGLYRLSRNPMYVGVLLIMAGWAILFRSSAVAWYGLAVAALFHLRVVLGEEPWLARVHGDDWQTYCKNVPRWLLRFPERARRGGA